MYRYKAIKVDGKKFDEHRYVMQIDDPDLVVHHRDGDGRNNDPSNLQIMTRAEHARLHLVGRENPHPQLRRHPSSGAYNRGCRCDECKKIRHEQYLARKQKQLVVVG